MAQSDWRGAAINGPVVNRVPLDERQHGTAGSSNQPSDYGDGMNNRVITIGQNPLSGRKAHLQEFHVAVSPR
jgi:hypothetical protein